MACKSRFEFVEKRDNFKGYAAPVCSRQKYNIIITFRYGFNKFVNDVFLGYPNSYYGHISLVRSVIASRCLQIQKNILYFGGLNIYCEDGFCKFFIREELDNFPVEITYRTFPKSDPYLLMPYYLFLGDYHLKKEDNNIVTLIKSDYDFEFIFVIAPNAFMRVKTTLPAHKLFKIDEPNKIYCISFNPAVYDMKTMQLHCLSRRYQDAYGTVVDSGYRRKNMNTKNKIYEIVFTFSDQQSRDDFYKNVRLFER